MFQNLKLDTAVDDYKTSAVHIDSMVTGLGLYVPTLNATSKVAIEIYTGDNPPAAYSSDDARLAASADTDWALAVVVLTSAGIAGNAFIAIPEPHSYADCWMRLVCDVDQTPGVGEPATLSFKLLARREK
jgi:hypothetical protein